MQPTVESKAGSDGAPNGVVVAIDMGGTKIYGTVCDPDGTIRVEQRVLSTERRNGDESRDRLMCLVTGLFATPAARKRPVLGIGIGAPGIVRAREGVVSFAPNLGWVGFPLKETLERRFGVPVFVGNDANMMALGEYGFGAGRGARSMMCIAVGTGLGGGIVIDGKLIGGHNQQAGEIGYMIPGVEFLGKRYDDLGALEQIIAGPGIALRARRKLEAMESDRAVSIKTEDVFEAARGSEAWAQDVIAETVDYLALGIANVTAILDPERIVLSGGVMQSADLLLDSIRQRLEGLLPHFPELVLSELGPRAGVLGAVMLVLTQGGRG